MSVFTREWVSPTNLSCFTDKTYIGGRSYSSTTDNLLDFCTHTHTKNWVASTDMNLLSLTVPWSVDQWNIKRCLQLRRNSNLQLSLLFFFIFGRDTIWRIPRKRVARGGKLWSPETLLYPNVSSYSVFSVLGKSYFSFQHMWNLEWVMWSSCKRSSGSSIDQC